MSGDIYVFQVNLNLTYMWTMLCSMAWCVLRASVSSWALYKTDFFLGRTRILPSICVSNMSTRLPGSKNDLVGVWGLCLSMELRLFHRFEVFNLVIPLWGRYTTILMEYLGDNTRVAIEFMNLASGSCSSCTHLGKRNKASQHCDGQHWSEIEQQHDDDNRQLHDVLDLRWEQQRVKDSRALIFCSALDCNLLVIYLSRQVTSGRDTGWRQSSSHTYTFGREYGKVLFSR